MAFDIQYRNKTLFVNKTPLNFDYKVGNAFSVNDNIIFLLDIPNNDNTLQNIYCLNSKFQFLWQVQSVLDRFENLSDELPFEGMSLKENGNISAYDFYGRNFEIDSNNGKIISYKIVR